MSRIYIALILRGLCLILVRMALDKPTPGETKWLEEVAAQFEGVSN